MKWVNSKQGFGIILYTSRNINILLRVMLEHCRWSIIYTQVSGFPQPFISHMASLLATTYTVAVPPSLTTKVFQCDYFCRLPQCDTCCMRSQYSPVLPSSSWGHLACLFAGQHPSLWPSPRVLWANSDLNKGPVRDLRRPVLCNGRGQKRKDSLHPFSPGSWKQTNCLLWLHSQDKPDLGIVLGNPPCLLATSLPLPLVSSNVRCAVQALFHLPKKPVRLIYWTPIYEWRDWNLEKFRTQPTLLFLPTSDKSLGFY